MRELYNGTLEDYFRMMESMDWKIPVGDTSNCCDHYDISAVAETNNHAVVAIIISKHTDRQFVTPVLTYEDGTSYANYGTPTSDTRALEAIERFNNDIIASREYGCKLGIHKVLTKTNKLFEFSTEDGQIDRITDPSGHVFEIRGLREM